MGARRDRGRRNDRVDRVDRVRRVARSDSSSAANGDRCSHGSAGLVCDGVGASAIDHAHTLAGVSTGFAIAAIAAGAASAVIYFTAPREPVVPVITPHAIGLAWAHAC